MQREHDTVYAPGAMTKADSTTSSEDASFLIGLVGLVVGGDLNNTFFLHEDGPAVTSICKPQFVTPYKAGCGRASVFRSLSHKIS